MKLLELPAVELEDRIHAELLENPALEDVYKRQNLACEEGHATDLINVAEALQEKKIAQIADTIFHRGENGNRVKPVSYTHLFQCPFENRKPLMPSVQRTEIKI